MPLDLQSIKGKLAAHFSPILIDMHTDSEGLDYAEYYRDLESLAIEINDISGYHRLEHFCQVHGLNDNLWKGMSFKELFHAHYK